MEVKTVSISIHAISKEIQDLRTVFGCSQEMMGRVIGVSGKTIARWESEENHPNFLAKQKIDELQIILIKMEGVIKKDKQSEWLNTPNEALAKKTPLEVIMQGRQGIQDVLHLLGRLEWGISE